MSKSIIHLDRTVGTGGGTGLGFDFRADDFTDLTTVVAPTASEGDLAYVENDQGDFWLPGIFGGANFFPEGIYLFTGGAWTSDRNTIAAFLEKNKVRVDTVDPTVNDDSTDLYRFGYLWFNTTTDMWFINQGLDPGAAIWVKLITSIDGVTIIPGGLVYGGIQTVNINANTSNLVVPDIEQTVLIRLNFTGNFALTGIVPFDDVRQWDIRVFNIGTGTASFKNNDAGSAPSNRFLMGANKTIQTDEGIIFTYDSVSKRWRGSAIVN